jgi:hypothetical protein
MSAPVDYLQKVLTISNEPIAAEALESPEDATPARKKTHPWSHYEDTRLIAGIFRFGVDNWTSIAGFVGNGRTRSQTSQRWQRGLDPHLSRDQWSLAEDRLLSWLVQCHGDKCWTQIAAKMGNRSDVQCRYRYKQMQKDKPQPPPFGWPKARVRKANSNFEHAMGMSVLPQPPPPARSGVRAWKSASQLPAMVPKKEDEKAKTMSASEESLFDAIDQSEESTDLFDFKQEPYRYF